MKPLGDRIKKARMARGMKQRDFAKVIGRGQSTVSQYESNERTPRFEVYEKICEVLPDVQANTEAKNYRTEQEGARYEIPFLGRTPGLQGRFDWTATEDKPREGAAKMEPIYPPYPKDRKVFALEVSDDSMVSPTGAGAHRGDTVIFSPALKVRHGDEALIEIQGGKTYFRAVTFQGELAVLRAHNPAFKDILVRRADMGKTARLIRIHRKV